MFSKSDLKRLLDLNTEYASASLERQNAIAEEIITLAPKIEDSVLKQTEELIATIQKELTTLSADTANINMEQYIDRITDIQDRIVTHADTLGVSLEQSTAASELKKLLDSRIKR